MTLLRLVTEILSNLLYTVQPDNSILFIISLLHKTINMRFMCSDMCQWLRRDSTEILLESFIVYICLKQKHKFRLLIKFNECVA